MKIFRLSVLLVLSLTLSINTKAAEKPLKVKSEMKLTDSAKKNGDWYLYIDDAKAESDKTGKPILANFTGSDWCGWCIRLKNEVFVTPEFKKWAKDNVVLLELDFPRKSQLPEDLKQQNASLQQAFQVRGYPTLWAFDLQFNEQTKQFNINALGNIGYVAGGPSEWIKKTNQFIKPK